LPLTDYNRYETESSASLYSSTYIKYIKGGYSLWQALVLHSSENVRGITGCFSIGYLHNSALMQTLLSKSFPQDKLKKPA
jgi:hypothetical protein